MATRERRYHHHVDVGMTGLYAMYSPMPYDAAREMEVELAIGPREAGYGVWQA